MFLDIPGALLVVILGLVAYSVRSLDAGGAAAGVLVGWAVYLGGGWRWFALLVSFLLLAWPATRFRYSQKASRGSAQGRRGKRGWPNVLANGGMGGLLSLLAAFPLLGSTPHLGAGYLGAVATAAADTLATEIGLISKERPRLITRPTVRVQPGTSGGVTFLGLLAAALSAALMGLLGAAFSLLDHPWWVTVGMALLGGMGGSTFDSVLGATIQGMNRCRVCGAVTEALRHHGVATETFKGMRLMDNNLINFLSTALGALVCIIIVYLMGP